MPSIVRSLNPLHASWSAASSQWYRPKHFWRSEEEERGSGAAGGAVDCGMVSLYTEIWYIRMGLKILHGNFCSWRKNMKQSKFLATGTAENCLQLQVEKRLLCMLALLKRSQRKAIVPDLAPWGAVNIQGENIWGFVEFRVFSSEIWQCLQSELGED